MPKSHDLGDARGEEQESLPIRNDRVDAFVRWHSKRIAERVGGPPRPTRTTSRAAAAELLRLADGSAEDLVGQFEFALTRTYWAAKVLTLPKWKAHYAALRLEWLASLDAAERRPERDRERPNPIPASVRYEGDRVQVSR